MGVSTHHTDSTNRDDTACQPGEVALALCGLMSFVQVIGLGIAYIYSAYLGRASFDKAFLFRAADATSVAEGFEESLRLGVHQFGDFVWPLSLTRIHGRGGYFGGAQLFFLGVGSLPVWLALIFLFMVSSSVTWIAVRIALPTLVVEHRLLVFVSMFLFVHPVLLSFDRGQIHLLMIAMLLFAFVSLRSGSSPNLKIFGSVILGIAVSMKLAPIFFIAFLWRHEFRRYMKIAIGSFVTALVVPLIVGKAGAGSILNALGLVTSRDTKQMDDLYFSPDFFIQNRAFNQSFKALADFISIHGGVFATTGEALFTNYHLFGVSLVIICVFVILSQRLSHFESLIVCAIATSRLIPISAPYTSGVYLVPLFWLMNDSTEWTRRSSRMLALLLVVMTVSVQVPIFSNRFASENFVYGSVVGPAISIFIILYFVIRTVSTLKVKKIRVGA